MAHTGSAQREPSMEEILASIRRIIQDSDTASQPGGGDLPAAMQLAEPAEPDHGEVAAFRAELEEPRAAPPSMAEIQAAMTPPADDGAAPTAQIHPLRAPVEPEAPDEAAPSATVEDTGAGEVFEPAETVPASAAPQQEETGEQEARPALISDHTGRQVAAAFGELSEAFAASRRRSFDDMAQEMLRPMLQDWLDNNLPMLVERLVREEIERVARGK